MFADLLVEKEITPPEQTKFSLSDEDVKRVAEKMVELLHTNSGNDNPKDDSGVNENHEELNGGNSDVAVETE